MVNSFQLRPSTHDFTSWSSYQQSRLTEVQQHMMMGALAHRTSAKLVVTLVGRISNEDQITSTPKVHTCRLMFVTRPDRQVRKQLGFVRPICSPSCRGPIFLAGRGEPSLRQNLMRPGVTATADTEANRKLHQVELPAQAGPACAGRNLNGIRQVLGAGDRRGRRTSLLLNRGCVRPHTAALPPQVLFLSLFLCRYHSRPC
jgi:hypothetical protein